MAERKHLEGLPALKGLVEKYGDVHEEARQDSLTGLSNRRAFREHLEYAAALAKRVGVDYSVATVDLVNLKGINDSYGLTEGDRAIKLLAGAMDNVRREHEMIARTGGDELSIIAVNGDLGAFVNRLKLELDKPEYVIKGHQLGVHSQVAVARPDESPDDVLARAQRIEKARHH